MVWIMAVEEGFERKFHWSSPRIKIIHFEQNSSINWERRCTSTSIYRYWCTVGGYATVFDIRCHIFKVAILDTYPWKYVGKNYSGVVRRYYSGGIIKCNARKQMGDALAPVLVGEEKPSPRVAGAEAQSIYLTRWVRYKIIYLTPI